LFMSTGLRVRLPGPGLAISHLADGKLRELRAKEVEALTICSRTCMSKAKRLWHRADGRVLRDRLDYR
jgi:hypothetical protein